MIEQAFEVATEFRFDVGQAIINADALKGAVNEVSHSASNALSSLNYLATGLIAHLGFGSGGLLTVLTRAIQLSEEFQVGSLGFVNNIESNFHLLTGSINNFNDKLGTSRMLMDKIGGVADSLGLPGAQLASITQLLASPLAARKKLGENYSTGIELAKNAMIGGEATGLHPMVVAESLARALSPGQGLMGKLFERLVNTNAFQKGHIIHPQQLAGMEQDKKIDLLIKAMGELGNNADYLAARANSLRVQFSMLKAQVEAVIKPIGDAIAVPLRKIFTAIVTFLKDNGSAIGKNIANFIADIFEDPKKLLVNLLQLKELGKDFKKSIHVVELYGTLKFLLWVLGFMGVKFNGGLLKTTFGLIAEGMMALWRIIPVARVVSGMFMLLRVAISSIMIPFAAAMLFFQGLSRAKAIARVSDISEIAAMTPRLSAVLLRWKNVFANFMAPFQQIIEEIGQIFAPLFKTSNYLEFFVAASELLLPKLEALSSVFVDLAADVHGFTAMMKAELSYLFNLPNNLMNAITSPSPLSAIKDVIFSTEASDTFTKSRQDFLDKNGTRLGKPGESAGTYTVNNTNYVDARFDMREQLEPDRIAFAVTEHIKKLVVDPRGGKGNSYSGGFANAMSGGHG